jgi:hypothetical protein
MRCFIKVMACVFAVGYYSPSPPYLNTSLINNEMYAMEQEYAPAIFRLRMNSLTILHHDLEGRTLFCTIRYPACLRTTTMPVVEWNTSTKRLQRILTVLLYCAADYITYDSLAERFAAANLPEQSLRAQAMPIYPANDTHRIRQAALQPLMHDWVHHMLLDFGIGIFFQPYEFAYPPQLCQQYHCSLNSTDLPVILAARYGEFFDAVPSSIGVVVTTTDSWTPRAGYNFTTLWSTSYDLAVEASLVFAAVNATGKQLMYRLWSLGEALDWEVIKNNTPAGIEFRCGCR